MRLKRAVRETHPVESNANRQFLSREWARMAILGME